MYENVAINCIHFSTLKWSAFVICRKREAEGVWSQETSWWLCADCFVILLSFSQTCYVSAGFMQACPGLRSRISIFSLSALQHFLFPISGSDSRWVDEYPLATFDSDNFFFSSQIREVMLERRTGLKTEGSKRKGKWKWRGDGRWSELSSLARGHWFTSQCTHRQRQKETHTRAYSTKLQVCRLPICLFLCTTVIGPCDHV